MNGQKFDKTLHQRRQMDGKLAYENILNIIQSLILYYSVK